MKYIYYDTEEEQLYTREQLEQTYNENKKEIMESCGAENFSQWLTVICSKNGTVKKIVAS